MPITVPGGVEIKIGADNVVSAKGPKGQLSQWVDPDIKVTLEDGTLSVSRPTDQKRHRSLHGLYRALLFNMVEGVSNGFVKEMEVVGVGYRAANTGQLLELTLGFSHPVMFALPDEVKVSTSQEKGKNPMIRLESADKELIGQVAAKIRALRKPEPYKGKGIRFAGEILRRKAGKAAAKK
jgi:large subunit ribosomal protein L6